MAEEGPKRLKDWEIENLFFKSDVGRNGTINNAELSLMFRNLGFEIENEAIKKIVDRYDSNKDGFI